MLAGIVGYRAMSGDTLNTGSAATSGDTPASIEDLEKAARANPRDAGAWQKLGFARFEQGDFAQAATAYRQAVEANPQNAVLWSSLGEARVMASRADPMPAAALEAFRKAAKLDPKDPRARYFLAVNRDLAGDHAGAIADWLALLADTPPGAPWENDLKRTIEQVGKLNKIEVADRIAQAEQQRGLGLNNPSASIRPGPTQQDLAAASSIPPSEQQAMARAMVERLETRLRSEPGDVDGWIMLIRSRIVQGDLALARKALSDGIAANPGSKAKLEEAAGALGLN